jgi:hypothetical protein
VDAAVKLAVGKKLRTELDLASLRQLLLSSSIDHVVIERVASRPLQGVTSTFKFGFSAGSIYGLLVGLQLPVSRTCCRSSGSVRSGSDRRRTRAAGAPARVFVVARAPPFRSRPHRVKL